MVTAVLDVRPAGFVEAATFLGGNVADGLAAAWSSLLLGLESEQGMAGTDDVGADWGGSYDGSAAVACRATRDLATGFTRLAGLLAQTGVNYASAEDYSVPGLDGSASAGWRNCAARWSAATVNLVVPPTAVGAAMPAPKLWSVVAHAVGRLWPDGHQDQLRAAAGVWRATADQVAGLAPVVGSAARVLLCQSSPEAGDAFVAVDAMIPHLHSVAGGYRQLAEACDEYAAQLDAAHSAILEELKSFAEWTAGIEATSALFSVVTLGVSEAIGQAGEAVEIARAAKVIKKVIDTLRVAAAAVRAEVVQIGAGLAVLPERLAPLLRIETVEARLVPAMRVESRASNLRLANPDIVPPVAPTSQAEAIANLEQSETELAELDAEDQFAELKITRRQIEKKFKHAADFGVNLPRGRNGFAEFEQRIRAFVARPGVARMRITFRGVPEDAYIDRETGLMVLQQRSGEFRSGWQLKPKQLRSVLERGVLGGD